MGGHVLQALIQSSKHTGEFLASNKAASPWSIQAPGDWFQKAIVFQIVTDAIRQLREPLLFLDQPFTLLLKSCGLSFDGFEGIRQ